MKCAKIFIEQFSSADRPELVGLVRADENGLMQVNRRCGADAERDSLFCKTHAGSAVVPDVPTRIKFQIHVSPHSANEFRLFETADVDERSKSERQVPQSLKNGVKVVEEQLVDVIGLIRELRAHSWYIYRLRLGRKQSGTVVEVSLARRGHYHKPAARISDQALERIEEELLWAAYVRVYRNVGFVHADHGDISLHSVEVVRTTGGEDPRHKLSFADGLWTLVPVAEAATA